MTLGWRWVSGLLLFLFIGTALSTQPPQENHIDSSLFCGLFPYPLEVGSNRILDDLWFINMQECQSDSKGRVTVLKQSFQKGKNKHLITIFALNVLNVADGKVAFCSFSFVWEIKYKEMICGQFFYKTKFLVSCEKFSLRKEFISLIQSMKRQAGWKERPFLFIEWFCCLFFPLWFLSVQKDFKETFMNIITKGY